MVSEVHATVSVCECTSSIPSISMLTLWSSTADMSEVIRESKLVSPVRACVCVCVPSRVCVCFKSKYEFGSNNRVTLLVALINNISLLAVT